MIRKITMIAGALALTIGVLSLSMPAQAQNEHLACYQLKHKIKVKPKPSGTLVNDVEPAGAFAGCKLKFLCTPTEKNASGPPADPNGNYCAWQCKGGKPVVGFTITDQFGNGAVTTKKLKFVLNECQVS